jgi:threonine dehydrogenase-like Zn-dependent dehydrogenase
MLAVSDVFGTGWFAAEAANVKPGMTVTVVGDGAVGLLAMLSAKLKGAERIIAMSRHASRQKLAREYGATDIVTERGAEGIARIKELTRGRGRRRSARVRRDAGVDAAGDRCRAPWRLRELRRCAPQR